MKRERLLELAGISNREPTLEEVVRQAVRAGIGVGRNLPDLDPEAVDEEVLRIVNETLKNG